jgi:NAD(P)-dependent dehydrogenase (short-subunit alcohol dehydrogenase family)
MSSTSSPANSYSVDRSPDLTGTVAVVTGGSRGIGRAISCELAGRGADLLIIYRENDDAAQTIVRDLDSLGVSVDARRIDVRDFDRVGSVLREALGVAARKPILVNCAGVAADRTIGKLTIEEWQRVIDTNLTGCFATVHAVLPLMKEAGFGRIVNISSIIGQTGNRGQANYAASKAGLLGFTKSVARESARYDITANAVCPGYIETEMLASVPPEIIDGIRARIPKHRLGTPEDVAYAVGFLASPRASYITGQTISINGGDYM